MKEGWETKTLGEVATLQRGFDLPKRKRTAGKFPLVSSAGISDSHGESRVAGPGVATGRSGSIGTVHYIENDFWPLNTVLYVKDFHGNDPRFIFHLLVDFGLAKFASGVGVPTLNRNSVHDKPVLLPALAEQQRIVGILDEAFEGIATARANAEQNLQNARDIFESHLDAVFTRSGEGWVEASLYELTTKIGSGATPRGGQASYKAEGISLIRSMNVYDLGFHSPKLAFIDDAQASKLSNAEVCADDVLLNITGASIARCCVVPEDVLPARVNQHVSIVRPDPDRLKSEFLHRLLTSRPYKERLLKTGEDGGSTRQALTKAQLQAFRVAYPCGIEDQQSIVTNLDSLSAETQRLESIYTRKIAALDELKQSLLQRAFAGEL